MSKREDAMEAEAIQLIQDAAGKTSKAGMVHTPPAGARCCDRLLFGQQVRRRTGGRLGLEGQPVREVLLSKA
eukprot:COSAG02_NODE_2831_length_7935_cov_5.630296_5_plen_72_part_00